MAKPLEIERNPFGMGNDIFKIAGFSDEEFIELKSMKHKEAKNKLLDLLDERNNDLGTIWWRSCVVCDCWFDNEFAYVKLADPCD